MSSIAPIVAHDLILVLLGFDGDLFVREESELSASKIVSQYLEEWDMSVLRRVLKTAKLYCQIRDWVEMNQSTNVYARGFAAVVDEQVLMVYENEIGDLESHILSLSVDSFSVSLTDIKSRVCDRWDTVFEKVISVFKHRSSHIVDKLILVESKCVGKFEMKIFSILKMNMFKVFYREIVGLVEFGVFVNTETPFDVPLRLFDDSFREVVVECAHLAQLLPRDIQFVKGDFPDLCNDFVFSEKIEQYVRSRRKAISGQLIRAMKFDMQPDLWEHLNTIRGVLLIGHGGFWEDYILRGDDCGTIAELKNGLVKKIEGGIRFTPVPPMDLIVMPIHVEKYCTLWKWLVSLKRCLVELSNRKPHASGMIRFWTNVFTYIQMDVIEEEWQKFKRVVQTCDDDLKAIQKAHNDFLDTVLTESMFSLKSLRSDIVQLAEISQGVSASQHNVSSSELRLTETIFMSTVKEFVRHLSEMRKKSDFRRIDRLLVKLDYNRFYGG